MKGSDGEALKAKEEDLAFDIRRSMLLAKMIEHWGMPEARVIMRNAATGSRIEGYCFPGNPKDTIHHVATIGVSALRREDGQPANWELFLALPHDLGGEAFETVADYLFNIALFSLESRVHFCSGQAFPESPLAPKNWAPKAILIDEPRGEPEDLGKMLIGRQEVALHWVVPIYAAEYELIESKGVEAFDELDEKAEPSVVDIRRPSLV